jgi:hypothetical protein
VIECGIPYEIILSRSQWSLLLDYLTHCDDSAFMSADMAIQAITHIDIGKATASKEQDLKNIMAIVKKGVGISRLNQEVIRALQKWMVGVGLTQHDNLSEEEQGRSKSYLGLLILYTQCLGKSLHISRTGNNHDTSRAESSYFHINCCRQYLIMH